MTLLLADAASGEIRRKNYRNGIRTLLLEGNDLNCCPRSEDLSTWTKSIGTGSATGSQADPKGGTTAYKLDDQDAVIGVNWSSPQFAAYTAAWTTRGFSHFYKADTAAVCEIGVFDITAAVYRARVSLTPVAGVLTAGGVAFTTGTGRVVAVLPVTNQPGHYRVLFEVDNIVVANNHRFIVRPAGPTVESLGASILWGFHAHNMGSPSHAYTANAGASGAVTVVKDDLRMPWLTPPGALSTYVKFYDTGIQRIASIHNTTQLVFQLGDVNNVDPRHLIVFGASSNPSAQHLFGGTVQSTVTAPTFAYGDLIEMVSWLYADGSVQLAMSVNGAVPTVAARSATKAFAPAWAADGQVTSQVIRPFSSLTDAGAEVAAMGFFPGIFSFAELQSLAAH
jgi:hypothetical protein